MTVGAALVIRPELGLAIRPSSGDTTTDFISALLVAGNTLSIVGAGNYAPHTAGTRMLFLVNSLIGASVLSLVMSYLVQVYSGLRERNALAFTIDLMTASTGDAAEMLARLGLDGDSGNAASELGNVARSLAAIMEAHHFYPLLFYFRFEDPLYSVPRFSFVILDLVTLIGTALDQRQSGWLMRSASVTSLRQCTLMLLATLDENLRPRVTERPSPQRRGVPARVSPPLSPRSGKSASWRDRTASNATSPNVGSGNRSSAALRGRSGMGWMRLIAVDRRTENEPLAFGW